MKLETGQKIKLQVERQAIYSDAVNGAASANKVSEKIAIVKIVCEETGKYIVSIPSIKNRVLRAFTMRLNKDGICHMYRVSKGSAMRYEILNIELIENK